MKSDLVGCLSLRVNKKNPMRSDAPGILFAGWRFKVSLNQFNSHDDHAHYIRQIKKCGIKYGIKSDDHVSDLIECLFGLEGGPVITGPPGITVTVCRVKPWLAAWREDRDCIGVGW